MLRLLLLLLLAMAIRMVTAGGLRPAEAWRRLLMLLTQACLEGALHAAGSPC